MVNLFTVVTVAPGCDLPAAAREKALADAKAAFMEEGPEKTGLRTIVVTYDLDGRPSADDMAPVWISVVRVPPGYGEEVT